MFDVGFWELALISIIALVILGPERLPRAARTVGIYVGKARRMMADVKADIDREIARSDLDEITKELKDTQTNVKKTVQDFASTTKDASDNSIADELADELKEATDDIKNTAKAFEKSVEADAVDVKNIADSVASPTAPKASNS
ncbi:MAG: Sec-independent protein translocase protein TatB [Arenicellales bacterium WSBS_2016_MAG_OTU3]